MPLIYYDKSILANRDIHPATKIDTEHPCYKMQREAVDGKSVFRWTKDQAYQMYKWYIDAYHQYDLVDEFGERVSEYDFKDFIKKSHYLEKKGKSLTPSQFTIEEMWNAVQMEKKILASIGEDDKDE